jgi:Zn-dependent peptidase ImmA (M78 family)
MRKRDIEARATQVLRDHGMLDMVVDPVKLANGAGLRVYNAKFGQENVHGLIALRGGTPRVYVNADDHSVRKRFTIAHELGHFFLHLASSEGEFIDDADNFRVPVEPDTAWTEERRQEWEANVFAAALLMNERLVRRMWPEIRDIEGMARWFQVSQQAMAIRLDELGLAA